MSRDYGRRSSSAKDVLAVLTGLMRHGGTGDTETHGEKGKM